MFENVAPIFGQKSLIGSHHMFSGMQGFQDKRAGGLISADEFDENIDFGIEDELISAASKNTLKSKLTDCGERSALVADHAEFDRRAHLRLNNRATLLQHLDNAGADGAEPH